MRRLLPALLLVLIASSAAARTESTTVRLRFEGLRAEGKVTVALFASEARWRARTGALRTAEPRVTGSSVEAVFEGLPPGRYAVMAYHDRNGDGRLNTLPVGLPTEPYGFSNNARAMFGPPGWGDAAFSVTAGGEAAQSIRLR